MTLTRLYLSCLVALAITLTSGCAKKDPKTAMTEAANQLVAAVEGLGKEMQRLLPEDGACITNVDEVFKEYQNIYATFQTKADAINLDGCFIEFKDAFVALKQTIIGYGKFKATFLPALRSAETSSQTEEVYSEMVGLVRLWQDAAEHFKAICQKLELDVHFNSPFWSFDVPSIPPLTPPEPTEPPNSPLDLPPVVDEDLDALREKILAEERAKELALIEEERNFVPLVDEPDALIPLNPQHPIWVTPDRTSVVLTGRVVLRDGFLELLACRVASKEHESILAVRVEPRLIHAALLVVNARPGRPMQMSPVFTPATGDRIDIILRWKDETGTRHESPAQDWVWDMSSPEDNKKPMTTHWVFSGSRMVQDYDGNDLYLADATGELVGLSNFVGSILDVPIQSSDDNAELMFGCFTERIPPENTLVTIVLTPVK